MTDLLTIIIPALNEADEIRTCLQSLQSLRQHGHEVIVVDGGSQDETIALSYPLADQVLLSPRGRAQQMNLGARNAHNEMLLFLHADTLLSNISANRLSSTLNCTGNYWGRFQLCLSGGKWQYRIIETLINTRSMLTGISTGDQTLFVTRSLFNRVGGFPDIPLMEDIAICQRLKHYSRPICLHDTVVTSSRRWEQNGVIPTILMMWYLRLAYSIGVSPRTLARHYYTVDVGQ